MTQLRRNRGAILIVVLGVLSLLALLATAFANLQSTERRVSRNYLNTVRARLVAESGIETAAARLLERLDSPFPDPRLPETREWIYYGDELDRSRPARPEAALERAKNPSFAVTAGSGGRPRQVMVDGTPVGVSGTTGGSYGRNGDVFSLRVRDLSGLIHVNDGLAQGADGSVSQNLRRVLNRLGDVVGGPGLGDRIVSRRPPIGYRSIGELRNVLAAEEFRKAAPFLTTIAWADRGVAQPVPLSASHLRDYPVTYYRGKSDPVYRFGRGVDWQGRRVPGDLAAAPPDPAAPSSDAVFAMDELNPQWIEIVERAPVNVNAAPREVLIALLADLQGFFLSYRRRNNLLSSVGGYWFTRLHHTHSPEGALEVASEGDEYGFLMKTVPFKFLGSGTTPPGDWVDAARVAQEIVDCRERRGLYAQLPFGGPFKTWRQFNAFCDHLVEAGVLEDRRPIFFDYAPTGPDVVKGGNITGYGPLVPSDYERHRASQALADVLKANFNPNLHLNELNPDANLHLLVDKTDLFVNSTEFLFTPTGYFEIESIGRILRPAAGDDSFQAPGNETEAFSKIVATVQLYEPYRETSQRDFARGSVTPRRGPRPTNSGRSLEIGPEPDNGPAPLENEWDGYIALPTIGGNDVAKAPGAAVPTPERPAERGETIGVHFQYDFDAYRHADGIREDLARVQRPGENVLNFPDPSESHGGPYDPLHDTPGRHRLARSFRLSPSSPEPALPVSAPLDLRVDGGYIERHASPAWWISKESFSRNMRDMNIVASFWVKPSYPPDRSGKPRLLFNSIRDNDPKDWFQRKAYLMLMQNAGHENTPGDPAPSEGLSLCGERQWWDPKSLYYGFAPFRPQSLILGRGYGDSAAQKVGDAVMHPPKYYATCQSVVNHESHPNCSEKSVFSEHHWTHVVVLTRSRPDVYIGGDGWYPAYDPPQWTSLLVNGKLLPGTRETMLNQGFVGGDEGDRHVDFSVHFAGDQNSVRFGAPSQVTSAGPFRPNYSCDATIDEFFLWNDSSSGIQQKAMSVWFQGRYAKPLQQSEDPESSEGVFVSQELDLARPARYLAPPVGGTTQTNPKEGREVLGIACSVYGENASDPELYVTDAATDRRLPVHVTTYLKSAGGRSGPFRKDEFSSASLRLRAGEKLQYLVRIEIEGLSSKTILLTTPVVDDVTLYLSPPGGRRYLTYFLSNESTGAP
jgi:hypothetical protein